MSTHVASDPGGSHSPPNASGWTDTEISVRLRRGAGGAVRVDGVLCRAPVWFRWDGTTLWLVGSGASPVGDDHIRVRVDVGPGVTVAVRSVAATIIYAAIGAGTRWDTEIHVADGAHLDWRPEPVILTAAARHELTTTVHVASGADVTLDEVLVLGRSNEAGGALRSTLGVDIDGVPTLRTSFDTSLPGWSGPAGVGGASVVANRLRIADATTEPDAEPQRLPRSAAAPPASAALLEPAPGCRLAVAVADDVHAARTSLSAVIRA